MKETRVSPNSSARCCAALKNIGSGERCSLLSTVKSARQLLSAQRRNEGVACCRTLATLSANARRTGLLSRSAAAVAAHTAALRGERRIDSASRCFAHSAAVSAFGRTY